VQQILQFQSFVLCKQFCDLGVDRLFGGEVRFFVPAFDQFFDLVRDDLLFRFGLLAFAYLIFIVHSLILLRNVRTGRFLIQFGFGKAPVTRPAPVASGVAFQLGGLR